MDKRLNHKLECPDCGTIYLRIPDNVQNHTLILSLARCGVDLYQSFHQFFKRFDIRQQPRFGAKRWPVDQLLIFRFVTS